MRGCGASGRREGASRLWSGNQQAAARKALPAASGTLATRRREAARPALAERGAGTQGQLRLRSHPARRSQRECEVCSAGLGHFLGSFLDPSTISFPLLRGPHPTPSLHPIVSPAPSHLLVFQQPPSRSRAQNPSFLNREPGIHALGLGIWAVGPASGSRSVPL